MPSADSQSSIDSTLAAVVALGWADPARGRALAGWLQQLAADQGLLPASIVSASADASFRRYFRLSTTDGGSRILMDAPPQHEHCQPFVTVSQLLQQAGVRVPQVLAWDQEQGFMLLTDLGRQTLLTVLDPAQPAAALPYFQDALSALLNWQAASRPGVLPPYDQALLQRELQLFPDWYLAQHKGLVLDEPSRDMLAQTFALLVQRNLAAPQVFVHRDYMPRNLMLPQ
jgi:aminoglycoside/choline kinase family phosphotransferase